MPRWPGYKVSPETSAKISAAQRGKIRGAPSPETRRRISEARSGHPVSEETRDKIRASLTGTKQSPEVRARQSERQRGHLPANIDAFRRGRKNRVWTEEERASIGAAKKGNANVLNAPVLGECVYCFGPATTRDHVIPRGRPGWDDPENVVLACRLCNAWKHNRTPEEWFAAG